MRVIIEESEVEKVHILKDKVVALDTDIFHIRLENMARNKTIDSLIKRLTAQHLEGTLTVPVVVEG